MTSMTSMGTVATAEAALIGEWIGREAAIEQVFANLPPPFLGLRRLAPGRVEPHHAPGRLGQAGPARRGDPGLAEPHLFIAFDDQRLGLGATAQAQDGLPELAHGVEPRPVVGLCLRADRQGLAERQFSIRPSRVFQEVVAELGQGRAQGRAAWLLDPAAAAQQVARTDVRLRVPRRASR